MYCPHQYLLISPKKKFVDAHFNAHNHAHLNAHESPKPVAPTTFMHPQFLLKLLTEMYWSHQYLSIDPKNVSHSNELKCIGLEYLSIDPKIPID